MSNQPENYVKTTQGFVDTHLELNESFRRKSRHVICVESMQDFCALYSRPFASDNSIQCEPAALSFFWGCV